jgi:hypothetical protein
LSDPKRKRAHRRLYDHRAAAIKALDHAVASGREALMKTVDFSLVKDAPGAITSTAVVVAVPEETTPVEEATKPAKTSKKDSKKAK